MPLESNPLGLRYATLRPGPSFAAARPENEKPQTELLEPPSVVERLRLHVDKTVVAQAVEDDAGVGVQRGQGRDHGYNAVLERATGGKGRVEMPLAELEAAVSWLEPNWLCDHFHLLDGDVLYAWSVRRKSRMATGL